MSQTWYDDVYGGSHAAGLDLQKMEYNFAALKSMFSGTGNPANAVEGTIFRQLTKNNWRGYNGSSWEGIFNGDNNHRIWVYRNDAMSGWFIDSTSATDKVLALKGGSTYVTGGAVAGSFSISHIHGLGSHKHALPIGYNAFTEWESSYGSWETYMRCYIDVLDHAGSLSAGGDFGTGSGWATGSLSTLNAYNYYRLNSYEATGDTATSSVSEIRPAAAVGTLQYMDLT